MRTPLYQWRDSTNENDSDYTITEILTQGILFNDKNFEQLIMDAFLEKHMNDS